MSQHAFHKPGLNPETISVEFDQGVSAASYPALPNADACVRLGLIQTGNKAITSTCRAECVHLTGIDPSAEAQPLALSLVRESTTSLNTCVNLMI